MTTKVHHVNCGVLHSPPNPQASCHCLLLEDRGRLALVDTGIGLADVADPIGRIGKQLIDVAGFQFHEQDSAVRQVERLGFRASDVAHVVLTHGDPDHTGGLADFPHAVVHTSEEELAFVDKGGSRYLPAHFAHRPLWRTYSSSRETWFGLEARPIDVGFDSDVLLVPLFGHTLGHCGVAVRQGERWLLHVGDAYYLRAELESDDHPVSALAAQRADDDAQRRASLAQLRRLVHDFSGEVALVGYHDFTEFPPNETVAIP
ncbi:MAG: MBL fold metallo-hydrolase [Lacipirellulaceae bacterium]